ncbi:PD-(D/E)XK nuclease family transposase [Cohnella hashimotonis]|uniref:PD-(D/E)XK nuclease family transposase n=1 Tax=Cohnella hashimotonis TaxID=2826895 RepID=A0ABT6TUQ6_9BACL|nr:PD-(D/E)XK nuclease family transposase [Cohnella hashimotonis]MDI4649928.1 PD-(D/E)XK nuclease family transposase [Cohnella hashimotonis]
MRKRLNPKNDYLFKRLFGEADSKPLLIGLLNAILRRTDRAAIADLTILDGKLLTKRLIEDKEGVLDIRCETADREQINVEMQVGRYRHMEKLVLHGALARRLHSRRRGLQPAQKDDLHQYFGFCFSDA